MTKEIDDAQMRGPEMPVLTDGVVLLRLPGSAPHHPVVLSGAGAQRPGDQNGQEEPGLPEGRIKGGVHADRCGPNHRAVHRGGI